MKLTWDQKRAQHSWQKIQEMKRWSKQGEKERQSADDYATYVANLPAAILTNGLGPACVQLQAATKKKVDDPHDLLYQHLQEWLCQENTPYAPYAGASDLIEAIVENPRQKYIWAVKESLAWLKWHKKFAIAQLKIRNEEDE